MTHPPCGRLVVAFELPIRPEPWRRAEKNGKRHYMDAKSKAYQAAIREACAEAMTAQGVELVEKGDLHLWCVFEKRDGRRCDGDNAYKAVADALNKVAYRDDRQIIDGRFRSVHYSDHDRVSVAVLRAVEV